MNYMFPGAFMANNFAMTILLIVLGLSGKAEMAAEVGIIQGATVALFFSFSANARSLILNENTKISAQSFMASRLVLLIPLAALSYLLSVSTAGIEQSIAVILIVRRCVEWLVDVHLSEMERADNDLFAKKFLFIQVISLVFAIFWFLGDFSCPLGGLIVWAVIPLFLSYKYIFSSFSSIASLFISFTRELLPHIGSTAVISISVYFFRMIILLLMGKDAAGDLFTSFAIGGLTGGVFANALGPSVVLHEQRSGKRKFNMTLHIALNFSFVFGFIVFLLSYFEILSFTWTGKSNLFLSAVGISLVGGAIMVYSHRLRLRILQNTNNRHVFYQDAFINVLVVLSVFAVYYTSGPKFMIFLYFISSLLSLIFYSVKYNFKNSV